MRRSSRNCNGGRHTCNEETKFVSSGPTLAGTPHGTAGLGGLEGTHGTKLLILCSISWHLQTKVKQNNLNHPFSRYLCPDTQPHSAVSGFFSVQLALQHKSLSRFWPSVSEQGVHQLTADTDFFYLRQFSSLHIPEHSSKEETEANKQSVLLMCSLEDMGFKSYRLGAILSCLISCRVPEHCWDHPTARRTFKQGAMAQHPCLWGTSGDVPAMSLVLCLSFAMKEMTQPCVYVACTVSRTHFCQGHCLSIALDGSC